MPRPEVAPEAAARFADQFKKREGPNYRVEENVLFIATKGPKGHVTRVYAEEVAGGRSGSRFVEAARAFFEPSQRLPKLTEHRLIPNKPWEPTDRNSVSLLIQEIPGRDEIDLEHSEGDPQSPAGVWITALVNRERDRLAYLGLSTGGKIIDTEILKRLRGKAHADVYLAEHGIVRDSKQGSIQLTLGDWIVTGDMKIPTEEVLQALYPYELRDDHFGAKAVNDGWAQTDLFTAFGLTIASPATENPVFANPSASQSQ